MIATRWDRPPPTTPATTAKVVTHPSIPPNTASPSTLGVGSAGEIQNQIGQSSLDIARKLLQRELEGNHETFVQSQIADLKKEVA